MVLSTVVLALLASVGAVAVTSPAQAAGASTTDRFAREVSRPGDRDRSASHIDHVYELQYRLKRVGTFKLRPNGNYGPATKAAVKKFQKRVKLRQTGVTSRRTWAKLIPRSTKNVAGARSRCAKPGRHVCYDRRNHQVTLWKNGTLWNSWLVRGGAWNHRTRVGTNPVYRRSKHHVSNLYGSPMPYSQFFDGGQALHGSGLMVDPWVGHSHGCINMYVEDARQLWRLTASRRLVVHVYGAWD